MRRITLSLVFVLLLPVVGFFSCEETCSRTPKYFDINGMRLSNYIVSRTELANGRFTRETEEGETVSFADHCVGVNFDVTYARREAGGFPPGAAFALSCIEPSSREKADTLFVITRNAWDATHPAGDTINDIVEAAPYASRNEDLKSFRSLLNYRAYHGSWLSSPEFVFRVSREPVRKDTGHAFRLVFRLQNGTVYTAETGRIRFR